jgi:hypothetical protein
VELVQSSAAAEAAAMSVPYTDEHSGLRSWRAETQSGDTRGASGGGRGGWIWLLIVATLVTGLVLYLRH